MKNLLFTAWKNPSRLKIGQFAHNHTFHFIEAKHVHHDAVRYGSALTRCAFSLCGLVLCGLALRVNDSIFLVCLLGGFYPLEFQVLFVEDGDFDNAFALEVAL